jgi:UDP-GlcNAc:polypeptide alpha-N-acetylglucosaminyltransferase
MRLLRAIVLGLGVALVCIVTVASLRMPRGTAQGMLNSGRSLLRGGGRPAVIDVRGDIARLQRAAHEIENEMNALADGVLGAPLAPAAKKRAHHRRVAYSQKTNGTIFVGISSFRDPQCAGTIGSLFAAAANPHSIHVGVAQYRTAEPSCIPMSYENCQLSDQCLSDNIRIRTLDPKHATGPAYGRFAASHLYHGEEYVLFAESHQRFAPKWDSLLVAWLHRLSGMVKRPVISTVPGVFMDQAAIDNGQNFTFDLPHFDRLCKADIDANGIPQFSTVQQPKAAAPLLQPWLSLQFVFAKAALLREVPLDPHLPFSRSGDDALYAARLYTAGWDIFAPIENVVYRMPKPDDEPKFVEEHADGIRTHSNNTLQRIQYLLEVKAPGTNHNLIDDTTTAAHVIVEADLYGLGEVRSVDDYYAFSGIDPVRRVVKIDWCTRTVA